jgi:hypothetical protein
MPGNPGACGIRSRPPAWRFSPQQPWATPKPQAGGGMLFVKDSSKGEVVSYHPHSGWLDEGSPRDPILVPHLRRLFFSDPAIPA